ncbi:MAG: M81 family metallopeptidase [Rhodospirillaceae bacterium]
MRLVIAMMQHETNTFSPVPTPLARFSRGNVEPEPLQGDAVRAAYAGTGSALGAYLELADAAGAEVVLPMAANAAPSGPVEDAAYDFMTDQICAAVAAGCDGVLLHLHGAMVTQTHEDGEGPLLQRLRALAPDLPIAVALDMHANLYPALIDAADIVAGYQTYPHTDVYETGMRAGRPLIEMIRSGRRPAMAWGNRPMLPHVMRQGTADGPNHEIQALAQRFEREGALSASFFTGFPHADIRLAGSSAVVVTDGDQRAAQQMCDELLDLAWERRQDFVYEIEPLAQSIARARGLSDGPIVLLDHYDNAASGGSMDTMAVIKEIIEKDLEDVAIFAVCDPLAVQQIMAAGIGNDVQVELGGKNDLPTVDHKAAPLSVTGRVKLISDGRFTNLGPMGRGVRSDMGPTVVLDTGKAEIVVISYHVEPNDLACFLSLGIDPRQKRYVMLKSRVHWRAGLGDLAKSVVECAGVGVCTSDYDSLAFKNVRRPIYPLDPDASPDASN